MFSYFDAARRVLDKIEQTQAAAIRDAAAAVADSLLDDGIWHIFGTGHSHMIAEEAYFRAGGLAPVNPVLFPALMQHEGPVTSTQLERLPGLAEIVYRKADIRAGDILMIVSNSGKNAVPVEMARIAREHGVKTIALTSLAQSRAAALGVGQTKKLFEICDIVIDNCGAAGDAALRVPPAGVNVSPTSSLAGIAIIEQIVYAVACAFVLRGLEPPVFKTANLPGGDEYNAGLIARYSQRTSLR
jgi:uncharacterized phosphosugar-binding protein